MTVIKIVYSFNSLGFFTNNSQLLRTNSVSPCFIQGVVILMLDADDDKNGWEFSLDRNFNGNLKMFVPFLCEGSKQDISIGKIDFVVVINMH